MSIFSLKKYLKIRNKDISYLVAQFIARLVTIGISKPEPFSDHQHPVSNTSDIVENLWIQHAQWSVQDGTNQSVRR